MVNSNNIIKTVNNAVKGDSINTEKEILLTLNQFLYTSDKISKDTFEKAKSEILKI